MAISPRPSSPSPAAWPPTARTSSSPTLKFPASAHHRLYTDRPEVGRIVGQGLFKFGDVDGSGPDVRLQHCLGLAYGGGKLFIADTYNNKIKICDPSTRTVKTFAGDGKPGSQDDPPRFYQPGGLSVGRQQPVRGRHEQSQDPRDRHHVRCRSYARSRRSRCSRGRKGSFN